MESSAHSHRPSYRTAVVAFVVGLGLGFAVRELGVSAYAQVMDPGQQRIETNQGISQLNAKMAEMLTVLRTGTLKVKVVGSDKTTGSAQSVIFESAPSGGVSPVSKDNTGSPTREKSR